MSCPDCGAPLHELDPSSAPSAVVACPRCPWRAATTNQRTPPFDPQRYTAFATSTLRGSPFAARLAVALGRSARDLLAVAAGTEAVAKTVNAIEVQRLAALLAPHGIALRIEPSFPWDLPAVAVPK